MRTLAPRRARTLLSAASAGLLAAGALSAAAPAIAGQATAAPATDPVDTTSTAVSTTDDTATSNAYIVKHKADSEPADVLTAQSAGTDVEGELPAATTTAIDEAADATSADVDVEAVTAHSGDLASVQLSSTLDEADAQAFVSSLTSDPSVEYVQPDIVMTALAVLSTSNDTYFSKQWDLGPASSWGMNATAAWSRATGEGVTVAGTIAAQPNNSTGTAGVAPNARIEPVRVLGLCGGSSSDIVDGITWASGGHVNGVPDNDNPANCDSVITVGSTGDQGARAYYSNYGSTVEVSAPGGDMKSGEDVLSTVDSGTTTPQGADYGYMQGTSRATPHVAGTIALMAQVKPSLTTAEATRILQDTSYPLASCDTGAGTCGTGIIDAAKAVASIAGTTPAPEPTAPATTEPTADPTPTTNTGNPTGGRGIGEYYYCLIFGCD
ncbi:S8 family serine peptidase [Actinomyces radicidentis]|uniref:S8 family serine peptidase n=1 Tax=Actinomyces radicidentis TaxID=111015 RepID=UPI0026DEB61A|nr:S8 family serine peptidase [Actinomyces radicidentis]